MLTNNATCNAEPCILILKNTKVFVAIVQTAVSGHELLCKINAVVRIGLKRSNIRLSLIMQMNTASPITSFVRRGQISLFSALSLYAILLACRISLA